MFERPGVESQVSDLTVYLNLGFGADVLGMDLLLGWKHGGNK